MPAIIKHPGTAANDNSTGIVAWASPSNALTFNGVFAEATLTTESNTSQYLKLSNCGFDLSPSYAILGISVQIAKSSSDDHIEDRRVRLIKGGVIQSADRLDADTWPTDPTVEYITHGGPEDLWDNVWTPDDINDSSFGVVISALGRSGIVSTDAYVDDVIITVWYDVVSETVEGGVVVGGSAIVGIATRIGGVRVGGTAKVSCITSRSSSGGVKVNGTAISKAIIRMQGGVVVAGSADVLQNYVVKGGVVVGGSGHQTMIDYVDGTGGVVLAGRGNNNHMKFYRYEASGTAIIGGSADAAIADRAFNTGGEIEIGGSASYRFTFYRDLTLLWNTRAQIVADVTFLWNTGRLINYWYRIIGKAKCILDPCCQRYIINVHARSLSELCEKLSKLGYKFAIESAQKFTTPADTAEVAILAEGGANFDCNGFEEVDLCLIPLCAEFCVLHDVVVDFEFDIIRAQVDAFFTYEAEDGVYITGTAPATLVRFLPDSPHVASGGIIMGGDADYISSGYTFTASGGIIMGGVAGIRSSDWDYIGGQWPSTTGERFGKATENLPAEDTDQFWSLTNRVLADDGLFASTDISHGKTSEYLVVRDFTFTVPDGYEMLHVYVRVDRKANQLGVKDEGVYLVVGDEIISENLAKATDWPFAVSAITTYDFTEAFDPDDIGDTNFGFAIRVKATNSVPTTIASIDFIAVEAVFENPEHHRIRMSGEAKIVSSAYSWFASGGIEMTGEAAVRAGKKFVGSRFPAASQIVMGGTYGYGYDYVADADSPIIIGGSAPARPSFQELDGSGGAVLSGEADVKPYQEFGLGGSVMGGTAAIRCRYFNSGTGGVAVGGLPYVPEGVFSCVGAGGITMGGVAGRRTEHWSMASDGNVAFVLGGADYRASDFGTLMQESEFDMTVDSMLVAFGADQHLGDAVGLNDLLQRCGCGDIPMVLNLEHGIARNNNFAQFLARNNLTISRRLEMNYNAPNDSWQTNLHYIGLSADANTEETWDVIFDVQCTQTMGSIFIGRQIWKFGMEMVRRNLTTGQDYDTRIVIGVLPDEICGANELKFRVSVDTQTGLAEVTPNSTIYQMVLFDNVGLFKNRAWITTPELIITVSQVGLDALQRRVDLKDAVLVE